MEVFDFEDKKTSEAIGHCMFTVEDLKNGKKDFQIQNQQNDKTGKMKLDKFVIQEWPDFLEYIRGGLQLNLMVAIDYTQSNRDPKDPNSLHFLKQNGLNQYQQAIDSVCSVLLNYDQDKHVPVYGFGGIPRLSNLSMNQPSHCFPLTGDMNNSSVVGLEGIHEIYKKTLPQILLSGPTLFSPVIQTAFNKAVATKSQQNNYHVLLILTDGLIEEKDFIQTINLIVSSSSYPLSILIIGVGDENFQKMEILDGDNKNLKNQGGQKAKRDLVQFIDYKKYRGNPEALGQAVLAEIPDQIRKYFRYQNIKPKPLPDPKIEMQKQKQKKLEEEAKLEEELQQKRKQEEAEAARKKKEQEQKPAEQAGSSTTTTNQKPQVKSSIIQQMFKNKQKIKEMEQQQKQQEEEEEEDGDYEYEYEEEEVIVPIFIKKKTIGGTIFNKDNISKLKELKEEDMKKQKEEDLKNKNTKNTQTDLDQQMIEQWDKQSVQLSKTVEEQKKVIDEKNQRIVQLNFEIQGMKDELEKGKQREDKQEKENEQLMQTNQQLIEQIQQLEQQRDGLEKSLSTLETQLQNESQRYNDLTNSLQEQSKEVVQNLMEKQKVEKSKTVAKTFSGMVAHGQAQQLKKAKEALEKQLEDQKRLAMQQAANHDEFSKQMSERLSKLQGELDAFRDKQAELGRDNDRLKSESMASTALVQQLKEQKQSLDNVLGEQKLQLAQCQSSKEELMATIQGLNRRVDDLQQLLIEESRKQTENQRQQDQQRQQLQSETVELQRQRDASEEALRQIKLQGDQRLQEQEEQAKTHKEEMDKKFSDMRKHLSQLNSKIENLTCQLREEQRNSKAANGKAELAEQNLQQLREELKQLQKRLDDALQSELQERERAETVERALRAEQERAALLETIKVNLETSLKESDNQAENERKQHEQALQTLLLKSSEEGKKALIELQQQSQQELKKQNSMKAFSTKVIQSQLLQSQKEKESLAKQLNQSREETATREKDLMNKIKQLEGQLEDQRKELLMLKEESRNYQEQLKQCCREREELQVLFEAEKKGHQKDAELAEQRQVNLDDLERKLVQEKDVVRRLQEQLDSEQKTWKNERESLKQQLEQINSELQRREKQVKQLEEDLRSGEEDHRRQLASLQEDKNRLQIDLEKELTALRTDLESRESLFREQKGKTEEAEQKLDQQKGMNYDLSELVRGLRDELQQLKQQIAELQHEQEAAISRAKEAEAAKEAAEHALKAQEQEAQKKSTIKNVVSVVAQSQLLQSQKQRELLEKALAEQRSVAEQNFQRTSEQIRDLNQQLTDKKDELYATQQQIKEVQSERDRQKAAAESLAEQLQHYKDMKANLENGIQACKQKEVFLQSQYDQQLATTMQLSEQLQRAQGEIGSQQQQAQEAKEAWQNEVAKLKQEISDQLSQKGKVESQLKTLMAEREVLQRDLQKTVDELNQSKLKLEEQAKQLSQHLKEDEDYQREIAALKQSLEAKSASLEVANNELQQVKAETTKKLQKLYQTTKTLGEENNNNKTLLRTSIQLKQEVLQQEIEKYKLAYNEFNAQLRNAKEEIIELKTQLAAEKMKGESEREQNEQLQKEVDEHCAKIAEIQKLIMDEQGKRIQAERSLEQEQRESAQLQSQIKQLESSREELEKQIKEQESSAQKTSEDLKAKGAAKGFSSLVANSQLQTCKKQKEELEKIVQSLKLSAEQNFKQNQEATNKLEQEVQRLTQENQTLQKNLDKRSKKIQELNTLKETMQGKEHEQKQTIEKLRTAVDNLEKELEKTRRESSQALETQIQEADRTRTLHAEEVKKLQKEIDSYKCELEALNKQAEQIRIEQRQRDLVQAEELARLRDRVARLQSDVTALQQAVQQLEAELQLVRGGELKNFGQELQKYRQICLQLEEQNNALQSKNADLLQRGQQMKAQIAGLKENLQTIQQSASRKEKENHLEIQSLRQQLAERTAEGRDLATQKESLERNVADLEQQQSAQTKRFEELLHGIQTSSQQEIAALAQKQAELKLKSSAKNFSNLMTQSQLQTALKDKKALEQIVQELRAAADIEAQKVLEAQSKLSRANQQLSAELQEEQTRRTDTIEENQRLSAEIRQLQLQLQAQRENTQNLQRDLTESAAQLASSNAKREELQQELRILRDESLRELRDQLATLERKSQDRIQELESNVKKMQERLAKLRGDKEQLEVDVARLRRENEEGRRQHEKELASFKETLTKQTDELEQANRQLTELKREQETLKEQVTSLQKERDKLLKELEECQTVCTDQKNSLATSTLKLEQQIKMQKDLDQLQLKQKLELDGVQKRYQDSINDIELLRLNNKHLQEDVDALEKLKESLEKTVQDLEGAVAAEAKKYQDLFVALQKTTDENLKQQLEAQSVSQKAMQQKQQLTMNKFKQAVTQSQTQQLNVQKKNLEKELQTMRTQAEEISQKLRNQIAQLEEKERNYQIEIHSLQTQIAEQQLQITQITELKNVLQMELQSCKSDREDLEKAKTELHSKLQNQVQRNDSLQRDLDKTQQEQKDINDKYLRVLAELEIIKGKSTDLQRQLEQQQHQKLLEAILQNQLNQLEQQALKHEETMTVLRQSTEANARLQGELDRSQQKSSELRSEQEALKTRLQALTTENASAQQEKRSLQQELIEQKSLMKTESSKVEQQIEIIRKLNESLQLARAETQAAVDRAAEQQAQADNLQRKIQALKQELSACQDARQAAEKAHADLQIQTALDAQRHEEQSTSIRTVVEQATRSQKELQAIDGRLQDLLRQNETLHQKNQALQAEIAFQQKASADLERSMKEQQEHYLQEAQKQSETVTNAQKQVEELAICKSEYQKVTSLLTQLRQQLDVHRARGFAMYYDMLRYMYTQQRGNVSKTLQDQAVLMQIERFKYAEATTLVSEAVEHNQISQEESQAFSQKQASLVKRSTEIQERIATLMQEVQQYQLEQEQGGLLWMDWQNQLWKQGSSNQQQLQVLDLLTEFTSINQYNQITTRCEDSSSDRLLFLQKIEEIGTRNGLLQDNVLKDLRTRLDASEAQFRVLNKLLEGSKEINQQEGNQQQQ